MGPGASNSDCPNFFQFWVKKKKHTITWSVFTILTQDYLLKHTHTQSTQIAYSLQVRYTSSNVLKAYLSPGDSFGCFPGFDFECSDNLQPKQTSIMGGVSQSDNEPHTEGTHFKSFLTCTLFLDTRTPTLNLLPSSSTLYSMIVLVFPLRISLGGGRVP